MLYGQSYHESKQHYTAEVPYSVRLSTIIPRLQCMPCTRMRSLSPGIRVGYARVNSRLVIYVAYHPNHAYRTTKASPHTITQLPRCNRTIAWKLSHHTHIYLGQSAHLAQLAHLCRLTTTAASRSSTREFPCACCGCVISFADMAQQKSEYKAR